MKTIDIEVAVSEYFNIRQCLIIPNVSWGFFDPFYSEKMQNEVFHNHIWHYEADLVVVSKSGYVTEVEIKVSKGDLIKDKNKRHNHDSDKVKYLFFAIPETLKDQIVNIPEKAGVLLVNPNPDYGNELAYHRNYRYFVTKVREPKILNKYKITDEERIQLMRLASMRIWGLKEKIIDLLRETEIRNKNYGKNYPSLLCDDRKGATNGKDR